MNNIIQSYETIDLKNKLFSHKNSETLVKVMSEVYFGDIEQLYYTSDRGETGCSEEVVEVYVCSNNMAVKLATIFKRHILSRLPENYVKDKNLILDREKTFCVDINFYAYNILAVPQLASEYTKFLKEVRKNLSLKCFIKLNEEALKKHQDDFEESLNSISYIISSKYKRFSNLIVVMPKEDGGFFMDRIVSITLTSPKVKYAYLISTPEIDFHENKGLIVSLMNRLPKEEDIKLRDR